MFHRSQQAWCCTKHRPGRSGSDVVVIANVAGAMVNVRLTEMVCVGILESLTVKVSGVALAVAVAVPLIAPVAAFNVRPAGSVPLVRLQA